MVCCAIGSSGGVVDFGAVGSGVVGAGLSTSFDCGGGVKTCEVVSFSFFDDDFFAFETFAVFVVFDIFIFFGLRRRPLFS